MNPLRHSFIAAAFRPALCLLLCGAFALRAQEQVDKADPRGRGSAAVAKMTVRLRVVKVTPEQPQVRVAWRRGGEGLGGTVARGEFTAEDRQPEIAVGAWSAWLPLGDVAGRAKGWEFPTIVVSSAGPPAKGKAAIQAAGLTDVVVEFEFAESGKVFKKFAEAGPKGATVGFAFPSGALGDKVTPEFIAQLNGLSAHARTRRERLEALFPEPSPMPKQFALIGHIGGYGEGAPGKNGGSGFGTRHCNPAILADECRTLRLLGVNGMVGSLHLADAAGVGQEFRRIYWGGPGSGDPMSFFRRPGNNAELPDGCPFDPALKPHVLKQTEAAIAEHRAAGAKESWGLWDDEMGVYAKDHIVRCEGCARQFLDYLRAQKVSLTELGKKSWDEVMPYNIWPPPAAKGAKARGAGGTDMVPAPENAGDALRYYYTFRFMTHATAHVFPDAAKKFAEAGVKLYAMQGPTPSWNGASLDWHEFYDHGANTAFVFETSNRDARTWQLESYLADIGRGIAARHGMAMGCLVKPHRGAPAQRTLSVVSRGTSAVEWYTYGPDYAKGDSFSQSPELLERVAHAARFLGKGEDFLYGAKFAGQPEVAFVSPRSSEIWGKATTLGITAFEDAKWVYLALAHAHIPVDILSEQQLAEGKLGRYKVLYVIGPNLRRDAAAQVQDWVRAGGVLWTDALGLSRDEANQPAAALAPMLGLSSRTLETWGSVPPYRASALLPLVETNPPSHAVLKLENANVAAAIAREPLVPQSAEVLARFADGKPAVTRQRHGQGEVFVAGFWAGLTYSAKVRRPDFDMSRDFDPALRAFIAAPALMKKAYQPVVPAEPLVEAVLLNKDGKRSVALMNWAYGRAGAGGDPLQSFNQMTVSLAGAGNVKTVRSLTHGPLPVANNSVVIPKMAEVDLLILE